MIILKFRSMYYNSKALQHDVYHLLANCRPTCFSSYQMSVPVGKWGPSSEQVWISFQSWQLDASTMNGSEVNKFEQVPRVDHQMLLAGGCDRGSTGKLGLGWGLGWKSEVLCPEGGWGQGVLYN